MTLANRLRTCISTPTRLFAGLALWLMALAVWRPLAVPDEGRYTDVARWMLRSGDWVVPRLNGLPFLHKPPLYYWIEAAGMAAFGPTLLVARLASLLGAMLACVAAYALVRRLMDERSARWTAVLLLTNPFMVLGSQYANLDMLVAGCISATIALAALACQGERPTQRWLWWAAYAAAGLSVLAKGLIGLVLPGAVFTLWALLDRQPRRLLRSLSLVGLVLLALIVVPWFLLAEQRVPGLIHFFVVVQHFQRYTEAGFNNAWGPWFYPAVLALGLLPWSLIAWPAWRDRGRTDPAAPAQRQSLQRLALAWFVVVMVFFSIPRSKLVGYILPLLPAAAILLGPWVARWPHRKPVAALGALLCVVLVGVATQKQPQEAAQLAQALKSHIRPTDDIAFWNCYDYAVPVVLDRAKPVLVVGDWAPSSRQLPDNWRRELAEGREFEPASGSALISPEQWASHVAATTKTPVVIWLWASREQVAKEPGLQAWPIVASEGPVVVLKITQPPVSETPNSD
ncbi:MAG: glycosyltransferase family 39 protein [Burkholderiales bacterium]|nr:glycosyltransferase family 39 protein [Burkholderiales bacterium]